MSRNEFDRNYWKNRDYWDADYDGIRAPRSTKQEMTRNAETLRDGLLGKDEEEWNQGTYGFHDADYTEAEHAIAWEMTDVDAPISEEEWQAMIELDKRLNRGEL